MQNAKAMDIQCTVCKSTFLKTTRAPQYVYTTLRSLRYEVSPASYTYMKERKEPVLTMFLSRLTEHASNKHSKTLADCFPGYEAA